MPHPSPRTTRAVQRLLGAAVTTALVATVATATAFAQESSSGGSKQIFIKTLQGKTITLDVNDGDSIGSVKDKIREIEGIPADTQQVWYAGRNLPDDVMVSTVGAASPSATGLAREDGVAGLGPRDAGPRMVMQTNAEGRSGRSVRGAYAMAHGSTVSLRVLATAGGLPVTRGSTVTARVTWGGPRAAVSGASVRATRPGAYRMVVLATTPSGSSRRAAVLLSVM